MDSETTRLRRTVRQQRKYLRQMERLIRQTRKWGLPDGPTLQEMFSLGNELQDYLGRKDPK